MNNNKTNKYNLKINLFLYLRINKHKFKQLSNDNHKHRKIQMFLMTSNK